MHDTVLRAELRFRAGNTPDQLTIIDDHDGIRRVIATADVPRGCILRHADTALAELGWQRVGDRHAATPPWWCRVERQAPGE